MKEQTLIQQFTQIEHRLNMLATHIQTMAYAIESLAREGQVYTRYLQSLGKTDEEKAAIVSKLDEIRKQVQEEMIERVKQESQVRKVAQEMKDKADAVKTTEVSTPETDKEAKA